MAEFENRDGGISQLNQMRALNYAFYRTGDEIELTRERARQIEKEALRKLRTDDNFKKKHRDYIDYLERVSKEKERKRAI